MFCHTIIISYVIINYTVIMYSYIYLCTPNILYFLLETSLYLVVYLILSLNKVYLCEANFHILNKTGKKDFILSHFLL